MDTNDRLTYLAPTDLRECSIQLRPVDVRTVEYQELYDSIKAHGLWQPLLVRPTKDGGYEVVDGFHRLSVCRALRIDSIPCFVRGLSDTAVLAAQVQANAVRLETQPLDYARHIWRIINEDRELTVAQVARAVKKSVSWVNQMLKIRRLAPEVRKAIERGEVSIVIAYDLARLPPAMQREMLPQAVALGVREFHPIVAARVKEFRHAVKNGKMENYYRSLVEPVPYLRPLKELLPELEGAPVGASLVVRLGLQTALEGWRACLDWVMHLDPDAAEAQRVSHAARQEYVDAQIEARKQNREKLRRLN